MEEGENGLTGYELKLSKTGTRVPRLREEAYQGGFQLINRHHPGLVDQITPGNRLPGRNRKTAAGATRKSSGVIQETN